jgi:hypothetical protein
MHEGQAIRVQWERMVEAYSGSASAYRAPTQWGGNKWLKQIPAVPPHIDTPRSGVAWFLLVVYM